MPSKWSCNRSHATDSCVLLTSPMKEGQKEWELFWHRMECPFYACLIFHGCLFSVFVRAPSPYSETKHHLRRVWVSTVLIINRLFSVLQHFSHGLWCQGLVSLIINDFFTFILGSVTLWAWPLCRPQVPRFFSGYSVVISNFDKLW